MKPDSEAGSTSFRASAQSKPIHPDAAFRAKVQADEVLLHPRDAARILNVSDSWLSKARVDGTGPRYVKIGRAVRYPQSSLREFIKSRMRGSTSES
jgi:predicted DNA-binding transcriptional regulator AlpA